VRPPRTIDPLQDNCHSLAGGSVRRLIAVALAVAALFAVTACTQPTANAAGVWVRVSPTTVTAGYHTQVQASCGENANAATVSSPAFGSVTLQPVGGVLGATVPIPKNTPRGTYDVRLSCPTGSQATTTLTVLNTVSGPGQPAPPVRGPDTGGGFLANNDAPVDRGPMLWLAVGVGSLLAAAAVARRNKRPALVRPRRPEQSTARMRQPDPEPGTGPEPGREATGRH
jgi:hypothetical protein